MRIEYFMMLMLVAVAWATAAYAYWSVRRSERRSGRKKDD